MTRPDFIVETTQKFIHPGYNEVQAGVQTDDIALLGLNDFIPYGRKYISHTGLANAEREAPVKS